jgi:hypothetical protein
MQCDRLTVSHESFNRPFQTVGNSVTSACGKISEYPSLRHVLSLLIIQAVNVIHSYHLFIYFSTCSIIFSNTTCYCNLTYLLLVFIYILSLVIHSYAPNYVRHIHSYTNSKKTKLINWIKVYLWYVITRIFFVSTHKDALNQMRSNGTLYT